MDNNNQTEHGNQYIIFKELWSPSRFRSITITPDTITVISRGNTETRPGPGEVRFNTLIDELRELGIFEWENSYVNNTTIDGYLWEAEVRNENFAMSTFGQKSGTARVIRGQLDNVRKSVHKTSMVSWL